MAALSLPLRVAHRVDDEDVLAQVLSPSGIEVEPLDPDQKLGRGCVDDLHRELVREAEALVHAPGLEQHDCRRIRRQIQAGDG